MGKIVSLKAYRTQSGSQKGFAFWRQRFRESFDEKTRIADLSDATVCYLAVPGEESTFAWYALIMGALGMGRAAKFDFLEKSDQMIVVDIHLFMVDQLRFEMMHRLGWIAHSAGTESSILEMVQSHETARIHFRNHPPTLVASHPEYDAYIGLHERDRESFIRRLLGPAIEAFKNKISG